LWKVYPYYLVGCCAACVLMLAAAWVLYLLCLHGSPTPPDANALTGGKG